MKFRDMHSTWNQRAKGSDTFRKTSLQYGSNPDLKPSKVKFQFLLNDAQELVKPAPTINNAYQSNAQKSEWKFFNSYETQDYQLKTREMLKDEINNIALRIARAREVKNKMSQGAWLVPEIESNARVIDEGARFHRTALKKRHGRRYVPPPKAENLQQLVDEEKFHSLNRPDYLKNSLYTRPTTAIR